MYALLYTANSDISVQSLLCVWILAVSMDNHTP